MQIIFYLLKVFFVLSLFYNLPFFIAVPFLCLSYHIFHHILVPKLFKYEPISLVDTFMLFESEYNRAHWGNVTFYDKMDYSKLHEIRFNFIKQFPKLRKKVVSFFGCSYFQEIPIIQAEKAIIKLQDIHTKDQLLDFVNKNFHQAFPKEGPLWKVFIIEDYSPKETVQITFIHHTLYDGLSGVFLTWLCGQEDKELLPNLRPITFKEKIFLYLGLLYTLPLATLKIALKKKERNPINNGKPLSGVKKMAYYDDISFEKIRADYKKCGCTLNDYFLGVLSKSLKEYFKLKDPTGVQNTFNIGFPINLRNKYPEKFSDVVLENNITAADLAIPLIDDVSLETIKISRIINHMKNSGEFFANYFFLTIGVLLMPKFIMCKVTMFITEKTTICFSNVPFFRKPFFLRDSSFMLQNEIGFLNNNSDIGVAMAILTYGEKVSFTVVSDTARIPEPDEFALIFRNNLMN